MSVSRTLRVCRACHLEMPADHVRGCGAVLGHCVGEPGVSCCACDCVVADSRLEAERWTEDGEGDWMCPACRGTASGSVRRLDHTRDGEEHRFVLSGVVECRTRDWGMATITDLRQVARTIDSPDDEPSSLICRAAHATRGHLASALVEASLRALGWCDVDVRECCSALRRPAAATIAGRRVA